MKLLDNQRILKCGPVLHYAVDLRIQAYMPTDPVPLKEGNLATKYPQIYEYFYSVVVSNEKDTTESTRSFADVGVLIHRVLGAALVARDVTASPGLVVTYSRLYAPHSIRQTAVLQYSRKEVFKQLTCHLMSSDLVLIDLI